MRKILEYDITLRDQVDRSSQIETAEAMGLCKQAIWFMLRDKRDIYLVRDGTGFKYFEVKGYSEPMAVKRKKKAARRSVKKRAAA